MAFLLTDGTASWLNETDWLDEYRLHRAGRRIFNDHSAILLVSGQTGFHCERVTSHGPISGTIWVTFEGFLNETTPKPPFRGDMAASYVFELLQKHNSLEPLAELKGNFSILIAFPEKQHYVIVRDPLGARTAFYATHGNATAISNRSHLIGGLKEFGFEQDPEFISHIFALRTGTPVTHSPFLNVSELRPGERISFKRGKFKITPRNLDFSGVEPSPNDRDWIERFHDAFIRAVDQTVDEDAPPFIMLSGGLDSGPVAAAAQKNLGSHGKVLRAISWRLPSYPNCDESAFAMEIASHIGLDLHTFNADQLLPFSSFDGRLMPLDFPSPNLFRALVLATYELGRGLGHDVFLTGGAGDLIYPRKEWLLLDQIRRADILGSTATFGAELATHGLFGISQSKTIRHTVAETLKQFRDKNRFPRWLTERARRSLGARSPEDIPYPVRNLSDRFGSTIIGYANAAETGIAEEYGLQRRDPFINEDLIKLMLKMPFSLSWRNGTSKWIMREAMKLKPYLPESIRTKARTGLLIDFYNAGFETNSGKTRDFLFREHTEWQEWVEPSLVKSALSGDADAENGRALAGIAVGYSIWRREIDRLPIINPS